MRIFATASKSSYFAPVQEPMYDLSNSTDGASLTTTAIFSGENGFATTGSSSELSYSKIFAYSASSSHLSNCNQLVAPRLAKDNQPLFDQVLQFHF